MSHSYKHIVVDLKDVIATLSFNRHEHLNAMNREMMDEIISGIEAYLHRGSNPEKSESGIPNPWLGTPYGLYRAKDGYIAIGMGAVQKPARVIGLGQYTTDAYASKNLQISAIAKPRYQSNSSEILRIR